MAWSYTELLQLLGSPSVEQVWLSYLNCISYLGSLDNSGGLNIYFPKF